MEANCFDGRHSLVKRKHFQATFEVKTPTKRAPTLLVAGAEVPPISSFVPDLLLRGSGLTEANQSSRCPGITRRGLTGRAIAEKPGRKVDQNVRWTRIRPVQLFGLTEAKVPRPTGTESGRLWFKRA